MKALNIYYRTLSRNKVFSLISIGGFSLSLAALVALVVALLTVSWQSWRAARKNPVEALRYE
jgi:ABC-type antimicrobial peptide transport system permease subunit